MQYKDLVEKMPTATYFYKDVSKDELDAIDITKFMVIEDEVIYVGTNAPVTKLKNKIFKSTGMVFE